MNDTKRIVFLDYLRVVACLMVMVVHVCECFYFGGDGGLHYDSAGDAFWATWIDSAVRACVPLFVIASSYLLFPVLDTYAKAVDLEMSWMFCSTGVALTVIAYFLILRKFTFDGWFYEKVIRPLSAASYGTYLMHIMVLVVLAEHLKGSVPTPLAIVGIAAGSFALSSIASIVIRKIPKIGQLIVG